MKIGLRQSALLIVLLLGVTALPYAYGFLSTPADAVYTGLMFDVPDHAQYWSWVTASRQALFISNTMTPEPNAPTFMNPMMWALAHLQTAFGLSFPSLFQWWRVVAILLLVPLLVAFIRTMVPEEERRTSAIVIALCGAGLGWMLVFAKRFTSAGDIPFPQDVYTVEPNTFWALLSYPNILFAHALILATMLGAWLAYRGKGWWAFVLAIVGAVGLSLSHAYDLITIYAVLGLFGLAEWVRQRRIPGRLVGVGLLVGGTSAPAALYYQRLTSGDPLWRSILSQYPNAGVWTPPHLHLLVLMGIPLVLAVWSIVRWTHWTDERRFMAIWASTSVVLIYLPVVYQIKLLSGWQFPLAVLAAHAWHEGVVPAFGRRLSPVLATALLLVAVSATNAYLFAWRLVDLRRHASPYYLRRDDADALGWLAEHATPADVVLAPIDVGQFVPNYGASRAYLAHWAMTNRFYERRDNVDRFFRTDTLDSWRSDLLTAESVSLILRPDPGPEARATFDPGQSPEFELLFSRPHTRIYRFHPRARVADASTAARP
jgi:hypothetical protein